MIKIEAKASPAGFIDNTSIRAHGRDDDEVVTELAKAMTMINKFGQVCSLNEDKTNAVATTDILEKAIKKRCCRHPLPFLSCVRKPLFPASRRTLPNR
jgi:hypothetical protein